MTITDDSAEDPAIDAGGPLLGDAYGTADRQADRRLPGRGWRSLGPGLLLRRRSLLFERWSGHRSRVARPVGVLQARLDGDPAAGRRSLRAS